MSLDKTSEYVNAEISGEHFISEHMFFYIKKGETTCYDGNKTFVFKSGEYGLIRKNRLARYSKKKTINENETVFIHFDETFLKSFQEKYNTQAVIFKSENTFIQLNLNELLPVFFQSLYPLMHQGIIREPFAYVKREELLLILLEKQPDLVGLFFDFSIPQKIDIEEFINKNFKFNVSVERFAFLTGRSLSAFKRDFKAIFNDTPSRWLVKKRLQEAHFLIEKKKQKPSDIYLDLGFETLSHFSYAFKKQFGVTLTEIARQTKETSR
ncbi:AraC family transcriptional regulator [Chitinophaga sancti]|uniref:helix-turn-helix domain-containing protein n=1 Tax=Chitinophaga sancti TaxID=1004 RepID=UPI002A7644F4|nr:AraC family transcriptional regulator [Chitinophaga sancti]WPQ61762.1 AraC family transcriptional regulator [Chitinophaga sancti]